MTCSGYRKDKRDVCHEDAVWRVLVQSVVDGEDVGSPVALGYYSEHYEDLWASDGLGKHFRIVGKEFCG